MGEKKKTLWELSKKNVPNPVRYISEKDTSVKVYLGRKAGFPLIDSILVAKKRIKIISPYLADNYVKALINTCSFRSKQNNDEDNSIDIKLITLRPKDGEWFKNSIISKLLTKKVDSKSPVKEEFDALKLWKGKLLYFSAYLLVAPIVLFILAFMERSNPLLISAYLSLLITVVLAITGLYLGKKAKNLEDDLFTYSSLFPVKIFNKPGKYDDSKFFIHTKLYIVDDVAYLGSLNMTNWGFVNNFESRIEIRDEEVIKDLEKTFDKLFEDESNDCVSLEDLGRKFFSTGETKSWLPFKMFGNKGK